MPGSWLGEREGGWDREKPALGYSEQEAKTLLGPRVSVRIIQGPERWHPTSRIAEVS